MNRLVGWMLADVRTCNRACGLMGWLFLLVATRNDGFVLVGTALAGSLALLDVWDEARAPRANDHR